MGNMMSKIIWKRYMVPTNCKKKKKSFLTDNPYMHMMSHTLVYM